MHNLLSAMCKFVPHKWGVPAVLMLASLSLMPAAQAQITLNFVYDSATGNTTASYSGSWGTISGPSSYASGGQDLISSTALYQVTTFSAVDSAHTPTSSIPWAGIGSQITAISQSGDNWGFSTTNLVMPYGYTAGTALSGTIVFDKTLSELGLTSGTNGTITFSGANNDISWSATTASAVPEPSTYALLFGLAALGGVACRRCRSPQRA